MLNSLTHYTPGMGSTFIEVGSLNPQISYIPGMASMYIEEDTLRVLT